MINGHGNKSVRAILVAAVALGVNHQSNAEIITLNSQATLAGNSSSLGDYVNILAATDAPLILRADNTIEDSNTVTSLQGIYNDSVTYLSFSGDNFSLQGSSGRTIVNNTFDIAFAEFTEFRSEDGFSFSGLEGTGWSMTSWDLVSRANADIMADDSFMAGAFDTFDNDLFDTSFLTLRFENTATNQIGQASYTLDNTVVSVPAPGTFGILGVIGVAAGLRRRH